LGSGRGRHTHIYISDCIYERWGVGGGGIHIYIFQIVFINVGEWEGEAYTYIYEEEAKTNFRKEM